jgi:hypothetical protein
MAQQIRQKYRWQALKFHNWQKDSGVGGEILTWKESQKHRSRDVRWLIQMMSDDEYDATAVGEYGTERHKGGW